MTGDGRYVVAVVAPWTVDNTPAGNDRGGIAYVIDAHTGAVRPLISGVSLYYFTPSCGTGSTVALTRYAGTDEQSTQLVLADAADATVRTVQTLPGQYTAAVPAPGGGFFAASGDTIVHLTGGRHTVRVHAAGRPFDLVANAAGGVDYLVGTGRSSASVWHLDGKGVHRAGGGVFGQLALFEGRGGRTVAAGATKLDPAAGMVALTGETTPVEASSLAGTAYSPVPARSPGRPAAARAAGGALPRTPLLLSTGQGRGARHVTSLIPATSAPSTAVFPPVLRDDGSIVGSHGAAATARGARPATHASARAATAQFTSSCAVPRNNVNLQVMQPSPEDVDWAANLAGRGLLTGSSARPQGYANLGLPAYSPSVDFPLPAPFGPGGPSIPREVLEGVFAQESNFNQASPHAVQGVAGNPLIADYYGAGGGYVTGVTTPDCGYGLGQVTTGMHTGDMSYDLQRKIAVDYAENVAASAQILAQKWNELAAAGITANNSDPNIIENWYLALWDYNSGLHPNSGSGPWGLGWSNNPANPDYPYNRGPFLHAGNSNGWAILYGDAATPGNWPYQEKVFGWMEVPIQSSLTGNASYAGTIETHDPSSNTNVLQTNAFALARPGINDFCDTTGNQCDPTVCNLQLYAGNCDPSTSDGTGPCTRADYECWWHLPDFWCSQANPCHSGTWEYNQGDAEPPAQSGDYYPLPACSVSTADIPPGTDVVDSQAAAVNLQGCSSANENWQNAGSFAFSYGDLSVPGSQQTDMDVHQLGTGLGGHIWFTHTNEPTDAYGVSLWGVTGTWTPSLPAFGNYDVRVFVPAAGATATEADYTIDDGYGSRQVVTVNQNNYTDAWVSLGKFWFGPGAAVSLTNLHVTSPGDLAFSGMAFVPITGTPTPYAILGDSYSAGEGAGNYDQGTDTSSDSCHRSSNSFGRQYAAGQASYNGNVEDLACSGAVISNITTTGQNGEPAQINALLPNAGLVTVTIGGNDAGFASVLTRCLTPGLSCEDYYNQDNANNEETLIDSLAPQLAATYTAIRNRAPNADVVAVTYPNIFKPGTTCPDILNLSVSDVDWLIGVANYLDNAIVRAAHQAGIDVLDERYAFAGHELCSGRTNSWVYSLPVPWTGGSRVADVAAWFHPTPSGHAQIAADLQFHLGTSIAATPGAKPNVAQVPFWVTRNLPIGVPTAATARNLLARLALTTVTPPTAYSTTQRAAFGDWRQRNNCSTRDWVLRDDALTAAQGATQALTPAFGCPATAGSWEWPYEATQSVHTYTTQAALASATGGMQIDHIVPIGDAYDSGAWNWTSAQKKDFYNDVSLPLLFSVSQASNGSKGDKSPDQWMPQGYPTNAFPTAAPGHDFACVYDEMWVAVKYEKNLTITVPERAELSGLLNTCA